MFAKVEHRFTKQVIQNTSHQPILYNENIGKMASTGTSKEAGETKKSFLSNIGKALIQGSVEGIHAPLSKNVEPSSKLFTLQVYSDNTGSDYEDEALEYTKPLHILDDSCYNDLSMALVQYCNKPPSGMVSPVFQRSAEMNFDCSYDVEFFKDVFNNECIPVEQNDQFISIFDFV